jgi:hypothetical protein
MGNQILSICSCENSEKLKKDYETFNDRQQMNGNTDKCKMGKYLV